MSEYHTKVKKEIGHVDNIDEFIVDNTNINEQLKNKIQTDGFREISDNIQKILVQQIPQEKIIDKLNNDLDNVNDNNPWFDTND